MVLCAATAMVGTVAAVIWNLKVAPGDPANPRSTNLAGSHTAAGGSLLEVAVPSTSDGSTRIEFNAEEFAESFDSVAIEKQDAIGSPLLEEAHPIDVLQAELAKLEETLELTSRHAHEARLRNGLGILVGAAGSGGASVTSKEAVVLTAIHANSTGYYKTYLPKDEYPELYQMKDAIKILEARIRSSSKPDEE